MCETVNEAVRSISRAIMLLAEMDEDSGHIRNAVASLEQAERSLRRKRTLNEADGTDEIGTRTNTALGTNAGTTSTEAET